MSSQPPLIAHVIYRLAIGGLENGLVNLINRMPADRFRHAVICLAGFTDFRRRIQRSDVQVYSLDKQPGKDLGAYWRCWRLLRRLRPALVHTRNLGAVDMQWIALAAGVQRRVHGEHGWDASDPQGRNPRALRIRRACSNVIQRYIAVSQDIRRWLEDSVHVRAQHITQIYNGVDVERFDPNGPSLHDAPWVTATVERPFVFGAIGRLDRVKNQLALLEAFARLLKRTDVGPMRLLIAGDGPLATMLRVRAAELGIAGQVWLPGARDDVPELLRAIDVFVLPSLNEGISNTILEAMAAARPVIAARVGGNPELVEDEVTGVLYDPASPDALFHAMLRYRVKPDMAVRHGAAGRERVRSRFSLEAMVNGYLDLYRRVLND